MIFFFFTFHLHIFSCLWKIFSAYEMSYQWNVLSMKCPIYEMSYLYKVLSLKCPIYEMSYLYNVLSLKCPIYEMSYLRNVLSMKCRPCLPSKASEIQLKSSSFSNFVLRLFNNSHEHFYSTNAVLVNNFYKQMKKLNFKLN